MFDTREYEWADITVIFGGVDLLTIRAVKCKKKREKEPIYAKGREPFAMQSGNSSYEGELELLKSGYDALEDAAGGNILDIKVDMLISYGNPSSGDVMRTKRISGVSITEAEEAAKQGDKFMPVTLPFLALGMKNV
ncbi:hypothetical protein QWY99_01255 [Flavobacterium branchiarum]|uniref:Phage tail protein n=1 Tax=Flavobacterium branchiarum TaxID=1114870 RepID=A0ABV5FQV6_9FLAO|nr:hypothetical protein [Flavobacterium branchiarum]MDN3671693.1 hypothetical protein [Flavobacterium branchiarum]